MIDGALPDRRAVVRLIRSPRLWLCLALMAWLAVNLKTLMQYPAPLPDEAWVGSEAFSLTRTGTFSVPVLGAPFTDTSHSSLWQLYSLGLGLFFRLAGIGLLQARLFSLLGALAGAVLMYGFGRELYDSRTGVLAGLIYAFSLRLFYFAHLVRPESWLYAANVGCLWLFARTKSEDKIGPFFALGLLCALAVDIYVTAVYISACVGLLVLVQAARRRNGRMALGFMLGGLSGFLYWTWSHFGGAGDLIGQWRAILQAGTAGSRLAPGALEQLLFLVNAFRLGFLQYSRIGPAEAALILAGLAVMIKRHRGPDWIAIAAYASAWLGIYLPYKNLYHFTDQMPVASLVMSVGSIEIATLLAGLLRGPKVRAAATMMVPGAMLFIAAGYLAVTWAIGVQNDRIDYEGYVRSLRALVPARAHVLGEGTWWWGFQEQGYTLDAYLSLYQPLHPELSPQEVVSTIVRERRADVLLIDEGLSDFYSRDDTSSMDALHAALVSYAATKCSLAGLVNQYGYGVERGGPALKRTEVYLCPALGS